MPEAKQPGTILPADMISVEEARERILSHFSPLPVTDVPLLDSLGQVTAQDITGGFAIPPHDNTAMDGYAVRTADTEGATPAEPITLRVIGYLPAGQVFADSVQPGEAVRIMTGAPMPHGTDGVVPFEETDEEEFDVDWATNPRSNVRVDVAAKPGANIRRAGEDVRKGEVVIPAGTVLGPAQLGVIGSLGLDTVQVHRRPRVAILSTGDELLRPGEPLTPGKIYDSNAYTLAAMVRAFGGVPAVLDVARDTVEALTERIHEGLRGDGAEGPADLIITSAGVSRGDFDVVKTVLAQEGEIGFWTVRMKPGKPLAFGTFTAPDGRTVPHLGLPGNPVSSMMTFELFGRPALYTMLGKSHAWERPRLRAITRDRIVNTDGRRFFARAILTERDGRNEVSLTGPQGSGVLTSMALANCYAICPEDTPAIEPGEECEVLLIDREAPVRQPGVRALD